MSEPKRDWLQEMWDLVAPFVWHRVECTYGGNAPDSEFCTCGLGEMKEQLRNLKKQAAAQPEPSEPDADAETDVARLLVEYVTGVPDTAVIMERDRDFARRIAARLRSIAQTAPECCGGKGWITVVRNGVPSERVACPCGIAQTAAPSDREFQVRKIAIWASMHREASYMMPIDTEFAEKVIAFLASPTAAGEQEKPAPIPGAEQSAT